VDIPQILEVELPKLLPAFAVRLKLAKEMPNAEAITYHDVPAIDFREDVYERLCNGGERERFTAAHELGHLFLHTGESRPRAVSKIRSASIPPGRSSEAQANAFASSFLMPEYIVRQFATPTELSSGCKVSLPAADRRMRELGLWPKGRTPPPEYDEFLRKMKELQKREK
jgi:Zn-dependent peptidase ImmA (M78 family)